MAEFYSARDGTKPPLPWSIFAPPHTLSAVNTIRATADDAVASGRRAKDLRDQIERQARDVWQDLITKRETSVLLTNQANIAAEFLELARKERELGNRTLLEVLQGETDLINANSDAVKAQTDLAIAMYTLLNIMGRLTMKTVMD